MRTHFMVAEVHIFMVMVHNVKRQRSVQHRPLWRRSCRKRHRTLTSRFEGHAMYVQPATTTEKSGMANKIRYVVDGVQD